MWCGTRAFSARPKADTMRIRFACTCCFRVCICVFACQLWISISAAHWHSDWGRNRTEGMHAHVFAPVCMRDVFEDFMLRMCVFERKVRLHAGCISLL